MRTSRRGICGGLLLTVTVACSSMTAPEAGLADAERRWASQDIQDYSWVVSRACECLPQMSGPTRVVVRAGAVESRWFIPGDEPLAEPYTGLFRDVDGMFELIRDELARGTPIVDVTYDRVYGYPVRVAVGSPLPDGEVVYIMSSFAVEVESVRSISKDQPSDLGPRE